MPSVEFPTGDTEHGHTSCEFTIDAVIMNGITKIAYGDSLEWGDVSDHRGFVVAHVRGDYKADDVDVTILMSHWQAFLAAAPADWRLRAFPIAVHRRTPDLAAYTDTVDRCRFMKVGTESAVGTDGHSVSVSFKARGVRWQGRLPFPGYQP